MTRSDNKTVPRVSKHERNVKLKQSGPKLSGTQGNVMTWTRVGQKDTEKKEWDSMTQSDPEWAKMNINGPKMNQIGPEWDNSVRNRNKAKKQFKT